MAAKTQETVTDDSVQIVLIGATGSGKSSSGNTILGKRDFLSKTSAKSVTLSCQIATEKINDWQVTVVDTPGWDCTELTEYAISTQIRQTVQNLRGPYSFLLVIKTGSVESKEIAQIYGLKDIFGPSFLEHTTILFSHSDDLEWKTFEEFLKEGGPEFQALLRCCNNRCHSWNNRDKRSDEDVQKLLTDLKKTEMKKTQPVKFSQDKEHFTKAEISSEQKGNGVKRLRDKDAAAMDAEKSKKPIQVLFLGMTGVGKTSSIKTLQRKGEQTEDKDVYSYSSAGKNLELIDSPGFDENPEEIQKIISTGSKTGFNVLIIVMTVDRFSPATKRTMQLVQDVLGKNATNYTLILFTGKDDLDGKPIETFIDKNADLREFVKKNRNRFHALNNRDASDQRQVDELLQKIVKIYEANRGEMYKKEECSDTEHERGKEPQHGGFVTSIKGFLRINN
uniref:AIG1-type G domain-containing protein n=1 Tax=Pygocentrus nattereri TaxID=42514 RepID=A0A3B4DY65_PYGNA